MFRYSFYFQNTPNSLHLSAVSGHQTIEYQVKGDLRLSIYRCKSHLIFCILRKKNSWLMPSKRLSKYLWQHLRLHKFCTIHSSVSFVKHSTLKFLVQQWILGFIKWFITVPRYPATSITPDTSSLLLNHH